MNATNTDQLKVIQGLTARVRQLELEVAKLKQVVTELVSTHGRPLRVAEIKPPGG